MKIEIKLSPYYSSLLENVSSYVGMDKELLARKYIERSLEHFAKSMERYLENLNNYSDEY